MSPRHILLVSSTVKFLFSKFVPLLVAFPHLWYFLYDKPSLSYDAFPRLMAGKDPCLIEADSHASRPISFLALIEDLLDEGNGGFASDLRCELRVIQEFTVSTTAHLQDLVCLLDTQSVIFRLDELELNAWRCHKKVQNFGGCSPYGASRFLIQSNGLEILVGDGIAAPGETSYPLVTHSPAQRLSVFASTSSRSEISFIRISPSNTKCTVESLNLKSCSFPGFDRCLSNRFARF